MPWGQAGFPGGCGSPPAPSVGAAPGAFPRSSPGGGQPGPPTPSTLAWSPGGWVGAASPLLGGHAGGEPG